MTATVCPHIEVLRTGRCCFMVVEKRASCGVDNHPRTQAGRSRSGVSKLREDEGPIHVAEAVIRLIQHTE